MFFLVFLGFSVNALDFGFGADFGIYAYSDKQNDLKANYLYITTRPSIILMFTELIELNPFFNFSFIKWENPGNWSPNVGNEDRKQFNLGGGAALFFHFLRSKYIHFILDENFFSYLNL